MNNLKQIKEYAQQIHDKAMRLTPGNTAHHRAAIAQRAQFIIEKVEDRDAELKKIWIDAYHCSQHKRNYDGLVAKIGKLFEENK